jgi:hypothetical protein
VSLASRLPARGRLGEWDEIVPLITFLCTPDAQWVTAQTIRTDGGPAALRAPRRGFPCHQRAIVAVGHGKSR